MRKSHRSDNATGPGLFLTGSLVSRCASYYVCRDRTTIELSGPLVWRAINEIPFALDALLLYELSQEKAYDHRTDLVS